ncbi:MAG: hypothetical protein K0Q55_2437 [Verrucomicrobia bacterium]|nr:hypothetical protein [Verrucomicrobiota bacterium]
MIDAKLLSLLCCPESHQPLQLADGSLVQTLNKQIAAGSLKNRTGHALKEPLDGALIREDRKVIYPIVNKLPILLIEEGILLAA